MPSRRACWTLIALTLLFACGDSSSPGLDAGSTVIDAAQLPWPLVDASTIFDAALDAQSTAVDAQVDEASAPDADAALDATADGAAGDAGDGGVQADSGLATGPQDWTMALYAPTATGHNPNEQILSKANVNRLVVKWRFDAASAGYEVGPIHSSPVVADDTVYVGGSLGRFFAIGPTGKLLWSYLPRQPNPLLASLTASPVGATVEVVATPITGAAVLPARNPYVIFADLDGNVYALDRKTGKEVWVNEDVDEHPLGGVVGNSLLLVDDMVVVGFSSLEDAGLSLAADSDYRCCSHRGLVVAFDAASGAERWRFYTVDAAQPLPAARAPHELGPSGADIWGQPSYDRASNTVFVGTGQNFSPTSTGQGTALSDAIIALDATTGRMKWAYQATADDIWNDGTPTPDAQGRYYDTDFGDSPKVYQLAGKTVVGAGQKNGDYHVLDAQTGALIKRTTQLKMTNSLGGFQNLGAYALGIVYQHGMDRIGPPTTDPGLNFNGTVMALSPDGSEVLWRFDRNASPMVGGLSVANGVLYFQSPIEELLPLVLPQEWALYALDAQTGRVLKRTTFSGRAISSPVVSHGRVYVTEGNVAVAGYGADLTGGLICLGLPEP